MEMPQPINVPISIHIEPFCASDNMSSDMPIAERMDDTSSTCHPRIIMSTKIPQIKPPRLISQSSKSAWPKCQALSPRKKTKVIVGIIHQPSNTHPIAQM